MGAPLPGDYKNNPTYTTLVKEIDEIKSGSSQDIQKLADHAAHLYNERNIPQNVIESLHQTVQGLLKDNPNLKIKDTTAYTNVASLSGYSPEQIKHLVAQMEQLRDELRNAIGPPVNQEKARACALKLENFLTIHKSEIFQIAKQNGYLPSGGYNYVNEYETSLRQIVNFLSHPTSPQTLELLNEGITQLTFYVAQPDIKK